MPVAGFDGSEVRVGRPELVGGVAEGTRRGARGGAAQGRRGQHGEDGGPLLGRERFGRGPFDRGHCRPPLDRRRRRGIPGEPLRPVPATTPNTSYETLKYDPTNSGWNLQNEYNEVHETTLTGFTGQSADSVN